MKKVLLLIGLAAAASTLVMAQSSGESGRSVPQKILSEDAREKSRQMSAERLSNNEKRANAYDRRVNFINRKSLPFKASLKKEQRQRLEPDQSFVLRYADFLRQPRTGLVKLFSDQGCEENSNILRVDANCLDWIPNSAFYSFRENEHTTDYFADITYKNSFLVTDGILSQGILAAIGDVLLENVSLQTPGLKFLKDYQPSPHAREALSQFIEISKGLREGGYEYRKAVRATENMTYALRVIAYRGNFYSAYRGRIFDVLYGDKRTDIILAFRVLKKEADGSVTLLWKEINRQKSPKVIFPKREKIAPRHGRR